MLWEQLCFYWFQGRNILWDDQNFKRGGDVKKGENQISKGESFFYYQLKPASQFVAVILVSPDTALREPK